jgi:hypothetical protein
MGTLCKVETLMGMREECLDQLFKIHSKLQEEKENLNKFIHQSRNSNEEAFKRVTKARKNLIDIVNGFFDRLENELNQNFEKLAMENYQECISVENKLQNMIEELENMEKELNGAEYIKVMLKVHIIKKK